MSMDKGDNNESVDWSNLPKELWPMIGKRFTTNIDLLQFRSTCTFFRNSSLPPPPTTLHTTISTSSGPHTLSPTSFYRLHPSSSSSSWKSWLVKIEETTYGCLRLLDPFTNNRLFHFRTRYPFTLDSENPKLINLLDFRFIELAKTYSIFVNDSGLRLFTLPHTEIPVKVVALSDIGKFFFVSRDGTLGFSQNNNEWNLVDAKNFFYDDIIVFRGQLYVVDRWGTISWIDSISMKLVQFSPPLCGLGKKKYLVEWCESLCVVDMYVEGDPNNTKGTYYEVVGLKVYRLDEEWGRWLDVKSLGEFVFVLSKDCNLSLLAEDYHGLEEDCVYFCCRGCASVFNLKTETFGTPKVFWPCPSLFNL